MKSGRTRSNNDSRQSVGNLSRLFYDVPRTATQKMFIALRRAEATQPEQQKCSIYC